MNYWVNRISHEFPISGVMLRYGYLSVGWSKSAPELLDTADNGRTAFKEQFHKTFRDISNEDSLWRFLKEYKIGDIIVVPFPGNHNEKFSIVKIQNNAEVSEATDLADIGFVRKVKLLKADMPRKALAKSMDSNLFSCQKTTYSIDSYKDVVQALIGGEKI